MATSEILERLKARQKESPAWVKAIPYVVLVLCAILFFVIKDEAIQALAGLAGLLTVMALAVFREQNEDKLDKMRQIKQQVAFENHFIEFYQAYEFKHSRLQKDVRIRAIDINEMCLDTFPPFVVIDGKEVIFFSMDYKEELHFFAERNNIPINNRLDIWGNICKEYVQTEYTSAERLSTAKKLIANGVETEELMEIHRKLGVYMRSAKSYASDWVYLGHYDVLRNVKPLSEAFYWYTMKVALRNFEEEKNED